MARRVIVCGGRYYADLVSLQRVITGLAEGDAETVIIQGGAPGADTLAKCVAETVGLLVETYPADWRRHGKAAGPRRNQEIADAGADLCIAFTGGRGTADMVRRARAAGIPVEEVTGP